MGSSAVNGALSERSRAFVEFLAQCLPLIEHELSRVAGRPRAEESQRIAFDLARYLYDPMSRFTSSGGKRVRPALALLGARAVGGHEADALSTGVAIELFQSAALAHDDIADDGELRRGHPCLHVSEGCGLALNMGDLALVQAFQVVLEDTRLDESRRLAVLDQIVLMERRTLEGQALDLGWVRDDRWDLTEEDCLAMMKAKTSWYSAGVPLRAGALAAGASSEVAEGLFRVGMYAGTAFQLADDLLNLVGDAEQGKDRRTDITQGKRTLAVAVALANLGDEEIEELISLLRSGTANPNDLERAVALIEAGGGIARCRELAQELAAKSQEETRNLAAAGLITDEACALLCSMSDFFVERVS